MRDNKYRKLSINTIIFAIGSFGSKAISFFLVPLYTNVLTSSEYGIADLITTLSSLALPLFSLSLGESILFFGLKTDNEDEKQKYFKNGFCLVILGSIFLCLLSPLLLFYHALDGYTWFLPVYSVLEIIRTYLKLYTKARNKNVVYAIDSIVYALFVAVLNVIFLLVLKIGVSGYLLSFVLSELLSILILFIFNRCHVAIKVQKIDKNTMTRMICYSAPLILNSVSWALSHSTDKIMLEALINTDAVGIYTVASKIPTVLNTIVSLFCQAWTISAYLESSNIDKKFYTNIFRSFSFVLYLIIALALFVERPFMHVYVGENFRDASNFVPFLLIATMYQNFASYFGSIIQAQKKNIFMMISTLTAAICNFVLNYFLIVYCGIQGACIATFVSFLIVFVLRLVFSKKIVSFPIGAIRLLVCHFVLLIQCCAVAFYWNFISISVISLIVIILINIDLLKKIPVLLKRYLKGKTN